MYVDRSNDRPVTHDSFGIVAPRRYGVAAGNSTKYRAITSSGTKRTRRRSPTNVSASPPAPARSPNRIGNAADRANTQGHLAHRERALTGHDGRHDRHERHLTEDEALGGDDGVQRGQPGRDDRQADPESVFLLTSASRRDTRRHHPADREHEVEVAQRADRQSERRAAELGEGRVTGERGVDDRGASRPSARGSAPTEAIAATPGTPRSRGRRWPAVTTPRRGRPGDGSGAGARRNATVPITTTNVSAAIPMAMAGTTASGIWSPKRRSVAGNGRRMTTANEVMNTPGRRKFRSVNASGTVHDATITAASTNASSAHCHAGIHAGVRRATTVATRWDARASPTAPVVQRGITGGAPSRTRRRSSRQPVPVHGTPPRSGEPPLR